ncbi:MAG: protein kinase [Candidatus Coatesbacteria bacterium]
MTNQPSGRGPHPPPDDFDGTLRQTDDAVGKTRDLSVPTGVEQQANAPRIAGYVLTALLGQGAYAQVWRAWQVRTRKWVAIKCFLARGGVNWMLLQREMERLIRLDKHPHIVSLLDADLTSDPAWYALDLLEAGSLDQYVDPTKLVGVDRAAKWMEEVAEALSYVHSKGIIHCDLKPANVLLDDMGHARVADFGQSKVLNESSGALGTLFYMAPEQAMISHGGAGVQPDVRWDVYALGASMYAVLTGKVPNLESLKARLTASAGLEERLNAYRELTRGAVLQSSRAVRGPVVDEDLSAIVGKCLAYDPNRRYDSMGAVLADLKARRESRPVTPLAHRRLYRVHKALRRNRVANAVAAVGIACLAVAFAEIASERDAVKSQMGLLYGERGRRMAEASDDASAFLFFARAYAICGTDVARANAASFARAFPLPLGVLEASRPVTGVCFSPDGKRVAVLEFNRTVRLWDPAAMARIGAPLAHAYSVRRMAFSPDGSRLVTAGADGVARVWDAETGAELGVILRHEDEVTEAVFGPAGSWIMTSGLDGVVSRWDAKTGKRLGTVRTGSAVLALALSPDRATFATGGADRTARLWRAGGMTPAGPPLRHRAAVAGVAFSPDGANLLAWSEDQMARLWSAGGVSRREQGGVSRIFDRPFSPDGRRLILAMDGRTLQLMDMATWRALPGVMTHSDCVNAAAFSPDGALIATASSDGTVKLWDGRTAEPTGRSLQHDGDVYAVAFSGDGRLIVSGGADLTARLWGRPEAGSHRTELALRTALTAAALSPDGSRVATGETGKVIRVLDARTGTVLWTRPVKEIPSRLALSGDGRWVGAVVGGTFVVFDAASSGPPKAMGRVDEAVPPCLSRDGGRAMTVDGGRIRLWNVATGAAAGDFGGADPVTAAELDADGVTVAYGTRGGEAGVWNSRGGKRQERATPAAGAAAGEDRRADNPVGAVALSPDGLTLVSAGADQAVRVRDAASGEETGVVVRPGGTVVRLAFSPDGRAFVTACDDGWIRIWHTGTGELLGKPLRADGAVSALVCASLGDGVAVVAVDMEGRTRAWDAGWLAAAEPPAEITRNANLATFRRVDERGSIVPLGPGELEALKQGRPSSAVSRRHK